MHAMCSRGYASSIHCIRTLLFYSCSQVELYPIRSAAFKRKQQKADTDTKSSVKLTTTVTKGSADVQLTITICTHGHDLLAGISVFDIDCTDDMLTVIYPCRVLRLPHSETCVWASVIDIFQQTSRRTLSLSQYIPFCSFLDCSLSHL